MRALFFAVLCMASFSLAAADTMARQPLQVGAVVAQQMQIRDDVMAQKGRYKDMSADKRVELLSKQAALLTMLEGKKTAADLTAEQQMQAFNTLEWIEAAVNNADDERMVCRREKTLGSTRTTRVCRTVAQEREAKDRAREEMEINHYQNRR